MNGLCKGAPTFLFLTGFCPAVVSEHEGFLFLFFGGGGPTGVWLATGTFATENRSDLRLRFLVLSDPHTEFAPPALILTNQNHKVLIVSEGLTLEQRKLPTSGDVCRT